MNQELETTAEKVAHTMGRIIARLMIWGIIAAILIFSSNTLFGTEWEYSLLNIAAVASFYVIVGCLRVLTNVKT